MDGLTLRRLLADALQEDHATSEFIPAKTSYDYLYQAAVEFSNRTRPLTTTQSITTVADTTTYTLSQDFLKLYVKDDSNRLYIPYNNGSTVDYLYEAAKEDVVHANNTTSVAQPDSFYIDDASLGSNVTGTCTTTAAVSNGEATLTASASTFSTDDVQVGDLIHETTGGSSGVVLAVTSETVLVTAIFNNAGNYDSWAENDTFVITKQPRLQLVIDPPPSTAGHTITVYYIQRPDPVYADFRQYRFDNQYGPALVRYAAWLYKYRDREPDFGDKWYLYFDRQLRQFGVKINETRGRKGFSVNLKKA